MDAKEGAATGQKRRGRPPGVKDSAPRKPRGVRDPDQVLEAERIPPKEEKKKEKIKGIAIDAATARQMMMLGLGIGISSADKAGYIVRCNAEATEEWLKAGELFAEAYEIIIPPWLILLVASGGMVLTMDVQKKQVQQKKGGNSNATDQQHPSGGSTPAQKPGQSADNLSSGNA